ncbi:hypothetical protein NC651_020788 [Populus alba x Populus x berolinensis]|nr:hypothetical protein NC651_020788 [Populus alba x Populus x berolinensis]
MGVHRLLPAVAPRGGRRLGRIFRPALSFRLWLLLLALALLILFCTVWPQIRGSMESGISSSHHLHTTGNIERFNKEVEQQQLQHSGYGCYAIKAPGRKHRRQRKINALFIHLLFWMSKHCPNWLQTDMSWIIKD